jgi:DNA-binding NarL/FixJ family response regulator
MVGVLLADDSSVFLAAAETLVAATPGFEVAATCGCGRDAIAIAARLKPDLALVDASMPDVDGTEAARMIATVSPETYVVLISADPSLRHSIPLTDKRSLSPALLGELWQRRTTVSGLELAGGLRT